MWGGSSAIRKSKSLLSDVDFWFVVEEAKTVKENLLQEFQSLKGICFVHDAGYFPWLGQLISLFFENCTFSIDVGICGLKDLHTVTPGYPPFFVWGNSQEILQGLSKITYKSTPEERTAIAFVNLLKVRKSLLRGHIWNAIEYVGRIRGQMMGLLTDNCTKDIHYCRPERDIEDYIEPLELVRFAHTCPQYSAHSVALCAAELIDQILDYLEKTQSDLPIEVQLREQKNWLTSFSEKPKEDV